MYKYEIINDDKYRVLGYKYDCIFIGSDADAKAKVNNLNIGDAKSKLQVAKNEAIKMVEAKMDMLLDYLDSKYRQSNRTGTIEDIKGELDHYRDNADKYNAVEDAQKDSYIKATYPANYAYMKTKNRTFEEQIAVARHKRELTHLASAKVEDLKSRIRNTESEEDFAIVKSDVDYINSLQTVKEFMQVMGA